MPKKLNVNIPQTINPLSYVEPKDEFRFVPDPEDGSKKRILSDFGTDYTEKYTAQEREQQKITAGSVLNQKEKNARSVERAVRDSDDRKERRMIEVLRSMPDVRLSAEKAKMLSGLLGEDPQKNRNMVESYLKGGEDKEALCADLLNEFLSMDLSGVDFSNDTAIASQAGRMEAMMAKYEAIMSVVMENPAIFDKIAASHAADFPEEQRQAEAQKYKASLDKAVRDKTKVAMNLISQYMLRKSIMTDPYYRSHEAGELSVAYKLSDPPEKKNLTFKLNMVYGIHLDDPVNSYTMVVDPDEKATDGKLNMAFKRIDDVAGAEWNKNYISFKGTRHEAFFERMRTERPEMFQRLFIDDYRVSGEPEAHKSTEKVGRSIGVVANMAAIQEMEEDKLLDMLTKLTRTPKGDPPSKEEIEAARKDNLEGLKQFKDVLKRQVAYLEHKYGPGITQADIRNLAAHGPEMARDFCFLTDGGALARYMNDFPGVMDTKDPGDMELTTKIGAFFSTSNMFMQAKGNFENIVFDPKAPTGEPQFSFQFFMKTYANISYGSMFSSALGDKNFNPLLPMEMLRNLEKVPEPIKWNVKAEVEMIEGSEKDVTDEKEKIEKLKAESGQAERDNVTIYENQIANLPKDIEKFQKAAENFQKQIDEEMKKPEEQQDKNKIKGLKDQLYFVSTNRDGLTDTLNKAKANIEKEREKLKTLEEAYWAKYGTDPKKALDINPLGDDKSDYKKIFQSIPEAKAPEEISAGKLMEGYQKNATKRALINGIEPLSDRMETDAVSRGKRGGDSYERMRTAILSAVSVTDQFGNQPEAQQLRDSLTELKAAAQEYVNTHTGIRHLFSGRSKKGAARVELARDLISAVDQMNAQLGPMQQEAPSKQQAAPAVGQNLRTSIPKKEPTLDQAVNNLNDNFDIGRTKIDLRGEMKGKRTGGKQYQSTKSPQEMDKQMTGKGMGK